MEQEASPCRRVAIRPKLDTRRISRKTKDYLEHPTTLAGHLLKRRKELGLLQREVAERIRINQWTYITWEKQGRRPKIWHWPAILRFLSYDPDPLPKSFAERIATYRRKTGGTFAEVARAIGVHECTVQSWEVGRHPPNRSADSIKLLERLFMKIGV